MSDGFAYLDRLVALFGPAAALALVVAAVIAYMYRRDVLADRSAARQCAEDQLALTTQLMEVVGRNATAGEQLAQTITRLSETIRSAEDQRVLSMARVLDGIRDAEAQRTRTIELLVSAIKGGGS